MLSSSANFHDTNFIIPFFIVTVTVVSLDFKNG